MRHTEVGVSLNESDPDPSPEVARRRTLTTATGQLAALDAEPTERQPRRGTAVLVPGFAGSKEDFIPLMPRIVAAGYRVVSYDQRGQYESSDPSHTGDYSVASFAEDLRSVIDRVGDNEPVHLVGHSFGALVARHLVIAEPKLVRSLTLLDSGPAGDRLIRARWLSLLALLIRLTGTNVIGVGYAVFRSARLPVDRLQWRLHRLRRTSRAGLAGMCLAMSKEPDRVRELAATSVPILVVFGENDDAWSPDVQKEMARRLGASAVVVTNAGHTPSEDQPQATADALLKFWGRIDDKNFNSQATNSL
jgi:pimeloyl-ACP methyl ester carboxylesterase